MLLRWHLAEVELIKNSLPGFDRLQFGKIGPERVKTQLALLFFGSVALEAVRFKKGFVGFESWVGFTQ